MSDHTVQPDSTNENKFTNITWTVTWEEIDKKAQKGGQGTVRKVKHRTNGSVGALKEMNPDSIDKMERRERMVREIKALQRLNVEGVPQVLDHNIDSLHDKTVPLYYVATWIDGKTLQQVAGGKPKSLSEALRIVYELLCILDHCHTFGVYHRDIKPDNILLGAKDGRIYLVDFGIAWTETEPELESLTKLDQELGNRFLRLADFAPGREKRDARADITFIVGILFFLLTGVAPRHLLDENGLPPHEARADLFSDQLTKDERWPLIGRIFRVGFQPSRELRFQNTKSLMQRIEEIINPQVKQEKSSTYPNDISALQDLFQTKIVESIQQIENNLLFASKELQKRLYNRAVSIGLTASAWASGPTVVEAGRAVEFFLRFNRQNTKDPHVDLLHRVEVTEKTYSFVHASYKVDSEKTEYYSGPAADIERLNEELENHTEEMFMQVARIFQQKFKQLLADRKSEC